MLMSLSARIDEPARRFVRRRIPSVGARLIQEQPLQCVPVGQVIVAYGLAGAHVQERRSDGLQRDALLFGPCEAVERELEGVGGARATGLPVDDLVGDARAAVALLVDGVDAAPDNASGDRQLERSL